MRSAASESSAQTGAMTGTVVEDWSRSYAPEIQPQTSVTAGLARTKKGAEAPDPNLDWVTSG